MLRVLALYPVEDPGERAPPEHAVDGGRRLDADEVGRVVEEVNVDEVEGRSPEAPPRPQIPLAGPSPLGKVRQRELALLRQAGAAAAAAGGVRAAVKVPDVRDRGSEEAVVPPLKKETQKVNLTQALLNFGVEAVTMTVTPTPLPVEPPRSGRGRH